MKMLLILFILLIAAGCSNTSSPENELPVDSILNAGESVRIEDKTYTLSTYLYRDFMPVIPPGGNGLIAVAHVETKDKSPAGLSVDPYEIYILHNGNLYKSFFTDEAKPPSSQYPYRIERVMRNGPLLETGINVDVVVKIRFENRDYYVKALNQTINRTD